MKFKSISCCFSDVLQSFLFPMKQSLCYRFIFGLSAQRLVFNHASDCINIDRQTERQINKDLH